MINWRFNSNNYDPNKSFELVPVGDHRVRIEEAEEQTSKTGRDMIKLTLAVSGHGSKLFHYIVFMEDRPEITDQNLGQLFDSFGIPVGDMNLNNWIGKVGAARVKHEPYDGKQQARMSYFILRSKQGDLPPWVEKGNGASSSYSTSSNAPRSFREDYAAGEEPDYIPF
ncbi:MAG: DUF669 domain-containing protein [Synergistales bacterium]|nr:DUF669 domain-containing protein [Synergistales bacterium]